MPTETRMGQENTLHDKDRAVNPEKIIATINSTTTNNGNAL